MLALKTETITILILSTLSSQSWSSPARSDIVFPAENNIRPSPTSSGGPNNNNLSNLSAAHQRAGLCPNLSKNVSRFFRFHRETQVCYRAGESGPCPQNMIFLSEPNNVFGSCDCNMLHQARPLIYHPETQKCHFIFSQGYCGSNEWLTINSDGDSICQLDPCLRSRSEAGEEMVLFQNNCVKLDSWSPQCPGGGGGNVDNNEAEDELVVNFVIGKVMPQCVPKSKGHQILPFHIGGVPRLKCAPGSAYSISGSCRTKVKFSFS